MRRINDEGYSTDSLSCNNHSSEKFYFLRIFSMGTEGYVTSNYGGEGMMEGHYHPSSTAPFDSSSLAELPRFLPIGGHVLAHSLLVASRGLINLHGLQA